MVRTVDRHILVVSFFFFKQKTAYEMLRSLVGSEMCIRDRGNSHHDDRAIGDSGLRMASRIQGYCAGASLLVIRNQAMASLESEGLFAVHQWDTNRKEWKLVAEDEAAQSNKAVAKKVMAAFRERRHMGLVDFDDHLAEPELDWLGTPNVVRAECL
eukprot:TRINITY_DN20813_c0_g1_i2.p1 TRINITY_DN20813_c0_g1~~TRINITY_DN20813_c0_g1_i2.p1  ORF type:complete len:156 (-),score=49.67 TRINITY_DN20813_c0_g1_i2:189-656(-)